MGGIISELWAILSRRERVRFGFLLAMILAGTELEVLGIGLIILVINLLCQPDVMESSGGFTQIYELLDSHSHRQF